MDELFWFNGYHFDVSQKSRLDLYHIFESLHVRSCPDWVQCE